VPLHRLAEQHVDELAYYFTPASILSPPGET